MYLFYLSKNENISPYTVEITSTKNNIEKTIHDNGEGILVDSSNTDCGTIDYESKQVVIKSGVFTDIVSGSGIQSLPLTISYINSYVKNYDDTLVIYIDSREVFTDRFRDISVIKELFKYILPTGYRVVFRKRQKIDSVGMPTYAANEVHSVASSYNYSLNASPNVVSIRGKVDGSDVEEDISEFMAVRQDIGTISLEQRVLGTVSNSQVLSAIGEEVQESNSQEEETQEEQQVEEQED